MPPNAPSALSAAIAGVSTFATRRRSKQRESPPPDSDSYYGVRSLHATEWEDTESSDSSSEDNRVDDRSDDTPDATTASLPMFGASPSSTSSSTTMLAAPRIWEIESNRGIQVQSRRPELAVIDSPPRLEGTPTPPAASLSSYALPSPTMPTCSTPSPPLTRRPPPLSHNLFDMLRDAPSASEPSSPASLESMCVTSISSLSRTSSLIDDWRPYDSEAERRDLDVLGLETRSLTQRGDTELVLPTLSLPSTSLHLGLERWNGEPAGTRVALLAGPERTRDVLGALAARRKCVQLPHGHVGVVENGHLTATVLTGLKAADIRDRASNAYAALYSLLDSDTDTPKLEAMIADYAARADWVHLVVPLDDTDTSDLDGAVPVMTLRDEAARVAAEEAREDAQTAALVQAATDSMLDLSGPTPMPCKETTHDAPSPSKTPNPKHARPWASEPESKPRQSSSHLSGLAEEDETAASTASLLDPDGMATVCLLEHVLADPNRTVKASTAACLAYVPPSSETSAASSTYAAPLPTIRSAGGEWEATLSRRLAHRRELDAQTRRRRSHPHPRRRQDNSDPSRPLFPPQGGPSSVGLAGAVSRAFAPVRKALANTSWTKVAIACAVAFAVGCGIWAVRSH
ncbi:hypothetical protein CspeluHIS016_0701450 [Cutaneotrichosporon spelunceum]|uniref:Uncharacterized protein n=1 Tax=Cutaneotrichosporon spelunceum TaxID=1672016 RepID=A0AAD3TYA3_9TREE|nr:hypothetical protein CspeluHIS016_0701450 [Cutaneotrichosporon spelunceum]